MNNVLLGLLTFLCLPFFYKFAYAYTLFLLRLMDRIEDGKESGGKS